MEASTYQALLLSVCEMLWHIVEACTYQALLLSICEVLWHIVEACTYQALVLSIWPIPGLYSNCQSRNIKHSQILIHMYM